MRPPFRKARAAFLAGLLVSCTSDKLIGPPPVSLKPSLVVFGGKPCGSGTNTAIGGENQSGAVGRPLTNPIIVQVLNVSPRNGQILNFAVTSGGGSVFANVVQTAQPTTGPGSGCNGIGENIWTLGPTAGPQTVEARLVDPATGATLTEAVFHATATIGGAANVKMFAGDNQTAVAGSAVSVAPAVIVTDPFGNPISGVAVTFAIASGGGSIRGTGSVATDARGLAAVGGWTLGNTAGPNTLTASVAGLAASPVTFSATGIPGPAASFITAGAQLPPSRIGSVVMPIAQVNDALGNGVSGVPVTFTIGLGGGSLDGVNSVVALSDVKGNAKANWTLGPVSGRNTLQATAQGLAGSPITFVVTSFCDCWTHASSLPTARWQMASGVIGGIMYTAGGYNDQTSTQPRNFEAYDLSSDTWTERSPVPTGRTGPVGGVINNKLYVVGGALANTATGIMEIYDPVAGSWTQGPDMPTPRQGAAAGVIGGVLYVVGGTATDYTNVNNVVEAFDPAANAWSEQPAMPVPEQTQGSAVINGVLYVAGGQHTAADGSIVYSSDLWAFTPSTGWTQMRSMSTGRQGPGVAVVNGLLYVMGGRNNSGPNHSAQELSSMEVYDPATNSWTAVAPMPTPRYLMSAEVINGTVIVVGGRLTTVNPTVLSVVEKYQP